MLSGDDRHISPDSPQIIICFKPDFNIEGKLSQSRFLRHSYPLHSISMKFISPFINQFCLPQWFYGFLFALDQPSNIKLLITGSIPKSIILASHV